MRSDLQLKVCGLTSIDDAHAAAAIGASFLGFILYPKSPRFLSLETFATLSEKLPAKKKVAVLVSPNSAELLAAKNAGFDFFQIHFPLSESGNAAKWSKLVGADRLWLAPKIPPETEFDSSLLPLADTWLIDTFSADSFGGTGKTGDWAAFKKLQAAFPKKNWILAGGLTPENIQQAIRESGARFVDVNSGVESAPGKKDHAKLAELKRALGF